MKNSIQKIPFLRLTLFFSLGIILQQFIEIRLLHVFIIILFFALFSAFLHLKYSFKFSHLFGVSTHLLFIFLGWAVSIQSSKKPVFYSNGNYIAHILEVPEEKPNSLKTIANIDFVKHTDTIYKTNEKILIYFSKKEAKNCFVGQTFIFNKTPELISNQGNPFEFDYRKYINRKKIYRQIYLNSTDYFVSRVERKNSLKVVAETTRNRLLVRYKNYIEGEKELQIIYALTLGYKRGLDPEIKKVFSSSGAMHVLAVSGLHVGIIYFLLNFLLRFLKRSKIGKVIFAGITIFCMWGFAFITGFSPSVQRAATMFSFVIIGSVLHKQTNIYNSLAASAFVLLCIEPNNLFEVGFQLSYSAVFGIIFLQPKLSGLFQAPNRVLSFIWSLLTVSFSAQISTSLLALFYFKQIPVYFWISNLFVIPAVMVLIPAGILLLLISDVSILANFLGKFINELTSCIYKGLSMVESLPFSIVQFSINGVQLVILASLLILLFLFIETKQTSFATTFLVGINLFFVHFIISSFIQANTNEIIVYNTGEKAILHLISGKTNYIVSDTPLEENDFSWNFINNTQIKKRLKKPTFLLADKIHHDENLLLEKNVVYFKGKFIGINQKPNTKNSLVFDYAINSSPKIAAKQFINCNLSNLTEYKKHPISNYFTKTEGAFHQKWKLSH